MLFPATSLDWSALINLDNFLDTRFAKRYDSATPFILSPSNVTVGLHPHIPQIPPFHNNSGIHQHHNGTTNKNLP